MRPAPIANDEPRLLLPRCTRLVHIGPPKTGTTDLQLACAQARSKLFDSGVYYPGNKASQRREIISFCHYLDGCRTTTKSSETSLSRAQLEQLAAGWEGMLCEINENNNKTIFISEEAIADHFSDEHIVQFARRVGRERIHVAVTLRSYPDMLLSRWNQTLKHRSSRTLEEWLNSFYELSAVSLPVIQRRSLDFSGLIERWANVVGPDKVTVVIPGRNDRDFLRSTFESLLGLPPQTLVDKQLASGPRNRSLTSTEAEMVRRVNERLEDIRGISWPLYASVMKGTALRGKGGAIRTMLAERHPTEGEDRLLLPRWAAERSISEGKRHAERIANIGVRTVGHLENLYATPTVVADNVPVVNDERLDMAVEALVGAVQAAAKIERRVATTTRTVNAAVDSPRKADSIRIRNLGPQDMASWFNTRELYRAMKIRLKYKFRTGRTMPLNPGDNE